MEFHVSNKYVQRESRKAVYLILFFSFVFAGLVSMLISIEKISEMIFPVIGLLTIASFIFSSFKRIREGRNAYPILELDELNTMLSVIHKDLKVIVDLVQIKNLRLQRKSGQLVSILVKTSSGENLRFEGYENLDLLASALERLTPQQNISRASFYHR